MEVGENKIKRSVSDISKAKIGIHFLIKILGTFILFGLDLNVCFPVLKKVNILAHIQEVIMFIFLQNT